MTTHTIRFIHHSLHHTMRYARPLFAGLLLLITTIASMRAQGLPEGPRLKLSGHAGPVHAAMFSRNGDLVATAGADSTLRIWSVRSGTELYRIRCGIGTFSHVLFLHDDRRFMTFSLNKNYTNGEVIVWDLYQQNDPDTLEAGADAAYSAVGYADDSLTAFAAAKFRRRLFSLGLKTTSESMTQTLAGGPMGVVSMEDGTTVVGATGSFLFGNPFQTWHYGCVLNTYVVDNKVRNDTIGLIDVTQQIYVGMAAHGNRLAIARHENVDAGVWSHSVIFAEMNDDHVPIITDSIVGAESRKLTWSPDGTHLISADTAAEIWHVATKTRVGRIPNTFFVAFDSQGDHAVSCHTDSVVVYGPHDGPRAVTYGPPVLQLGWVEIGQTLDTTLIIPVRNIDNVPIDVSIDIRTHDTTLISIDSAITTIVPQPITVAPGDTVLIPARIIFSPKRRRQAILNAMTVVDGIDDGRRRTLVMTGVQTMFTAPNELSGRMKIFERYPSRMFYSDDDRHLVVTGYNDGLTRDSPTLMFAIIDARYGTIGLSLEYEGFCGFLPGKPFVYTSRGDTMNARLLPFGEIVDSATFRLDEFPSSTPVISSDGRRLAHVYGGGKNIRIYDLSTRSPITKIENSTRSVASLFLSPDGERVYAWMSDTSLNAYSVSPRRLLFSVRPEKGFNGKAAWLNADGSLLVVANRQYRAILYDAVSGDTVTIIDSSWIQSTANPFSRSGELLYTTSPTGTTRIWEATTGEPVSTLLTDASAVARAFSPDGSRMAVLVKSDSIHLYDVATGARLRSASYLLWRSPDKYYSQLLFRSDGLHLAAAHGYDVTFFGPHYSFPYLTLGPDSIDISSAIGSADTTVTFTLHNTSAASLTLTPRLSAASEKFSLPNNGASFSVAAGESHSFPLQVVRSRIEERDPKGVDAAASGDTTTYLGFFLGTAGALSVITLRADGLLTDAPFLPQEMRSSGALTVDVSLSPNPVTATATATFIVPTEQRVRLRVVDMRGSVISELLGDRLAAGIHSVMIDVASMPSGEYVVEIVGDSMRGMRSFIIKR